MRNEYRLLKTPHVSTGLWKIVTSAFISQWSGFSLINFLTNQWPQPLHSSTKPSATSLPFLTMYKQEPRDLLLSDTFLTCKKAEFHRRISRKFSKTHLCVLHTSSYIVSTDSYDWQQICWYTLRNGCKILLVRNPTFFWPCPEISNFLLP